MITVERRTQWLRRDLKSLTAYRQEGFPVVFLHGSGPGVTAYANWHKLFPILKDDYRIIAPDLVGFGYTERVEGQTYSMRVWVQQTKELVDALGIEKANLVGH